MEAAYSLGADAVWILDDDSWPQKEALEALMEGSWDPKIVRHAIQIDPKTSRLTWPMWIKSGTTWRLILAEKELSQDLSTISKSSWTGALIPKEIRNQVGPVNGELFIRGEDEEYPWRIAKHGFTFAAYHKSKLDHPGSESLVHWQFLGKNFFVERGLTDWKLYYKVRNMVWLKRQQSTTFAAVLMAAAFAVSVSLIDGIHKLPLILSAVLDGWRGNLGRWSKHP